MKTAEKQLVFTEEQQKLISHIFVVEGKDWNTRVIEQWKNHPKAGPILKGLDAHDIYLEGKRFKNNMNKKIGLEIY